MPASARITKDDVQAELRLLDEMTRRFPALTILTEQAPPDDFDPERIGLAGLSVLRRN